MTRPHCRGIFKINGARRALESERNFLEVSEDIIERVDPVFFSDPLTAAMKALGMM